MSSSRDHQRRRPSAQQPENAPESERNDEKNAAQAAEVSENAAKTRDDIDDIIDEAEELLRLTLGFAPDELVDPEEMTKRAKEMVDGFQQKGGQ